jgi:hypothetical protein
MGALFDPYNKFTSDKSSSSYPEEEIVNMLDVVSKRFHRITSYGNADPSKMPCGNVSLHNVALYSS